MIMIRTLTLALLMTLVGLSGCLDFLGDDAGDDGTDDGMDDGGDDGMDNNGTGDAERTYHATLEASPAMGDVPLNVTFTSEVFYTETSGSGNDTVSDNFTYEGNLTYRLTFGDGSGAQEGNHTDYPLEAVHEYSVAGNYTATVTVTFEDGKTAEANINVTVEQGEPPREDPDQLVFEAGPVLGCAGDFLQEAGQNCITYTQGAGSDPIDGMWVPLDERYYGYDVLVENGNAGPAADTDGFFVNADGEPMSDINAGGDPASGTVPNGAAWLFAYSYGTPAVTLTVTFS